MDDLCRLVACRTADEFIPFVLQRFQHCWTIAWAATLDSHPVVCSEWHLCIHAGRFSVLSLTGSCHSNLSPAIFPSAKCKQMHALQAYLGKEIATGHLLSPVSHQSVQVSRILKNEWFLRVIFLVVGDRVITDLAYLPGFIVLMMASIHLLLPLICISWYHCRSAWLQLWVRDHGWLK